MNKNSGTIEQKLVENVLAEKDMEFPKIVFGTSSLGNLYQVLPINDKVEIVNTIIKNSALPVMFDTAGKYGAGLALETLGKSLKILNVKKESVIISNKLGWLRTELSQKRPTFEPDIWKGLEYDAYQNISYDGILKCYEQGKQLLGEYPQQLLSVHDPDEYLESGRTPKEKARKYDDIKNAYQALQELKKSGEIKAIGVGAKNWKTIEKIHEDVPLDWVMFANSMTVYNHPKDLLKFIDKLRKENVKIINSAVFNGGFLTGSNYFNYRLVSPETEKELYKWRNHFYQLCDEFQVSAAAACVHFALNIPGVNSVALNSSSPKRTLDNIEMGNVEIDPQFWIAMKSRGLIRDDYNYL